MAFSFTVSPQTLSVGDTLSIRMYDYGSHDVFISIQQQDGSHQSVHSAWFPADAAPADAAQDSYTVRTEANWLDGLSTTPAVFRVYAALDGVQYYDEEPPFVAVTLRASESMRRPSVGALSFSPVQPESLPERYAGSYIAALTGVKVQAAVTLRFPAAGESIRSVLLSWPGGGPVSAQYNAESGKYEALAPPVTENTTFTLTAEDSRGRSAASSKTLTGVLPYTLPTVTVQELARCDAGGNIDGGGAYCRIRAGANIFTELDGNSVKKFTVRIGGGQERALTDGVSLILGGELDPNSAYTVTVTVQDQISGEVRRSFRLAGKLRDLVLRRGENGTHLGVGMSPVPLVSGCSIQLPAGGTLLIDGADVIGGLRALLGDVEGALGEIVSTGESI